MQFQKSLNWVVGILKIIVTSPVQKLQEEAMYKYGLL
jgi:hypothetical protein